jgi:hypothetical protein
VVSPRLVRIDLDNLLRRLWEDGDVQVSQLWDAYARYCYLPRLCDVDVLRRAVALGPLGPTWREHGFAVASSYHQETGLYMDLVVGRSLEAVAMESLLVQPELAEAQMASESNVVESAGESGLSPVSDPAALEPRRPRVSASLARVPEATEGPHEFYGTVTFVGDQVGGGIARLYQEVLRHLAAPGIESSFTVEIRASAAEGFDDDTVQMITENAQVLKFGEFGFRED